MSTNAQALHKLHASDVEYCDSKDRLVNHFNKDTEDHVMLTLHDDGLYRHLRFKSPGTGFYWFDLITWPGNLTINGDMGTYTFARTEDMFTFFTGYINTHYWAEKLRGTSRSEQKQQSPGLFKQWLIEDFWETSRDLDTESTRLWWEAIREEILDRHSFVNTENRDECIEALRDLDRYDGVPDDHYTDCWEADWSNYSWHLEYCLAAIVTGIRTYQASKTTNAMEATK